MTFWKLAIVISACIVAFTTSAEAGSWQWIGASVGETSGFSYRSLQEGGFAGEAGVGWSIVGDDAVQVYAAEELEFLEAGHWQFYGGAGVRIKFQDNTLYGFRFPLGVYYHFSHGGRGWQVFIEASPLLDLSPEVATHISALGGLRWSLE